MKKITIGMKGVTRIYTMAIVLNTNTVMAARFDGLPQLRLNGSTDMRLTVHIWEMENFRNTVLLDIQQRASQQARKARAATYEKEANLA